MADLPVLRREPTCPAALAITGACRSQQGVVCRLMQQDVDSESGVGMDAGRFGFLQHEATAGVYLNLKGDPSSVTAFCYGDALPVVHDESGARASYTSCPVWEAEKDRIAEGKSGLYDEPEPEPVAMGMPDSDSDPWIQARRDLDLLAPVGD